MHPDWSFQLNAGEFLKNTKKALMSTTEIGAYCNLLCFAWLQERTGFLPLEDEAIRLAAEMSEVEWQKSREYVLALFSKYDDQYCCPSLVKQAAIIVKKGYPTRFGSGYQPRIARPKLHRPAIPKHIRQIVLSAGRCKLCGATASLAVDHIYPYSRGGTHEIGNLQCLCKSCNSKKSNKL